MLAELVEVELRRRLEGVVHIAEEVERQQAARVVGAERNLAAGVRRDGHKALVGIAVGHALADDRIPEEHAGLGRLPRIVDDLLPELLRIDVLLVLRVVGIDRELLVVAAPLDRRTHELVVDLDRDVGARHLARVDLRVDEALGVGVLDREGEHQGAAASVLRHLARRVRVALHEGDDTRRREGRVEHGAARGADVREVMPHAAAPLHELHLLLVHAEDAAVGVGRVLVPDDEAVGERRHLEVLAAHRRGVLLLDAFDLRGDAFVHLAGCLFINVPEGVLQGILADPHRSGQVVAVEIGLRRGDRLVVIDLLRRVRLDSF